MVSIHAPARGATALEAASGANHSFNPRARAGRDVDHIQHCKGFGFQSTRPRGARPANSSLTAAAIVSIHAPARGATFSQHWVVWFGSFNPRARAGRDWLAEGVLI